MLGRIGRLKKKQLAESELEANTILFFKIYRIYVYWERKHKYRKNLLINIEQTFSMFIKVEDFLFIWFWLNCWMFINHISFVHILWRSFQYFNLKIYLFFQILAKFIKNIAYQRISIGNLPPPPPSFELK